MEEEVSFVSKGSVSHTIDTRTVLYGVFGDPVAQSKSPLMLNRAFAVTGINAAYAAFHVTPSMLKDAIAGVRALGLRGVNITIPHKVEVMAHLDAVDESARMIGAVNTIVNDGGRLTGYNTDGVGYVRSLKEETGFNPAGKRILVLGAGGAARGIVYSLVKEKAKEIIVANRTPSRAEELAASIEGATILRGMGMNELVDILASMDLIINTTQVGMHPFPGQTPFDVSLISPHMLISDIIYNPRETLLLKEAQLRGAAVHGGLGMFVHQGAYAYELWTGQSAPVVAMRQIVEQALAEG
ncbi:MAG: shikimate dehydrogenase [Gorillibacterium sp.]|nr:shikimate dehydrogenase [Gorillibacterium sp.]